MTRKTLVAAAVVAALVFAACGSDKKQATTTSTKKGKGGLAVYTVAPLKDIVTTFVTAYNKTHAKGQLKVVIVPAAAIKKSVTSTRNQIVIGGNAVKAAKKAKTGSFGRNIALIAVSKTNPHNATGLTAFAATSGLKTQVCGAKTTLGNFTALVLIKAKVKPNPATLAFDCQTKALADVASGKLDAALMFRVGTKLPSGVKLVTIPDAQNIVIPISYAAIGTARGIAAFQKFLATKFARGILTRGGYLP
jgi:hypothetical protein